MDGGHDYLRRCGDLNDFEDLSECVSDNEKSENKLSYKEIQRGQNGIS